MSVLLCVVFVFDSQLPSAETHPATKAITQSCPSSPAKFHFLIFTKVSLDLNIMGFTPVNQVQYSQCLHTLLLFVPYPWL